MKKIILITICLAVVSLAFACTARASERISGSSPTEGKITAPVRLSWTAPRRVEPGESAEITITGMPATESLERFEISARLPEGVTLLSGVTTASGTTKQELSVSFRVSAEREGLQYLSFMGLIVIDGNEQASVLSIPLQVGDTTNLQKQGKINSDDSGNQYHELPAGE